MMISRKIVSLCCTVLVCSAGILSAADGGNASGSQAPACTVTGAFVTDADGVAGSLGSTVKITGYGKTGGMEFSVTAYDDKTAAWIPVGTCTLKGFSDTGKIKFSGLSKHRYFAVAASDGSEFTYTVKKDDGALWFTVYDKGADVTQDQLPYLKRQRAYVFDAKKLEGDYDDFIKLDSKTTDPDIKFEIYVYDQKAYKWVDYGTGVLKEYGDSDTVNTNTDIDIEEHRYFAIESMNDKDYAYTVHAVHENVIMDNIHIEITDLPAPGTGDSLN